MVGWTDQEVQDRVSRDVPERWLARRRQVAPSALVREIVAEGVPAWAAMDPSGQAQANVDRLAELVGPWDREDLTGPEVQAQRKEWLQTMRERMSAYADVLVCLGGKGVRPDVPIPGVLAEASLMLEKSKPLFFAAALGGFAQSCKTQERRA